MLTRHYSVSKSGIDLTPFVTRHWPDLDFDSGRAEGSCSLGNNLLLFPLTNPFVQIAAHP